MSFYLEFAITATIKQEAANALIALYKKAFEDDGAGLLQSLLNGDEDVEATIKLLSKGRLALHTEFKSSGGDDLDFFLDKVLAPNILTFEEGWYIYESEESRTQLSFDTKSRKFIRKALNEEVPWAEQKISEEEEQDNQDWEEEMGNMTPQQWRKIFAKVMHLISDLKAQRVYFEENTWADISDTYFTALNLENGFYFALKKKFLTSEETKVMKDFDKKLRSYCPPDYNDDESTLEDPEWQEVSRLAGVVLKGTSF